MVEQSPITLAITGASGSWYGLRLLEQLIQSGRQVYLMVSDAARQVMPVEMGLVLPAELEEAERFLCEHVGAEPDQLRLFGRSDWMAPVASGSNAPEAMVIAPCSTGTLSSIASGASNNLIERAADVVLKEQRQLILMVRETPLSTIHLENMLKLSRMGVTIMPASPGFYNRPEQLTDLIDFMVARMLDHLDMEHSLCDRWGDET
ncbi:MAG: UbiX family flavin prenyltransferase [Gammaproteobacteria bacterium]|nr:UbiX family flavin prenyltransferase [Gammaproteobacteria bacterium]